MQMEHPEAHLLFENHVFRTMVLPHLPKPRGVEIGAREDEGWEAMAMRDELTDVMLHTAFGDAILKEVSMAAISEDRNDVSLWF